MIFALKYFNVIGCLMVYDEIKNTATKYCKIKRIGLPNENLFYEHSMLQQQNKHQPFVCYEACVL